MEQKTRIVILGAGYGGMMTAIRLAGKTKKQAVEITLVNALEHFIERLKLHEAAMGGTGYQHAIDDLLDGTGVKFVRGWVTALDAEAHQVTVETQMGTQDIAYDKLVYALGSVVDQDSVAGVREYTYVFNPYGAHSTDDLRLKLNELAASSAKVVFVGGGATGIEGAAQLRAIYPDVKVSLVTQGQFGAFKGERIRKHFQQAFETQGIPYHELAEVVEVRENELILQDERRIEFDVCVWSGGFKATPIARDAGLSVNERGQILVDAMLRSVSHPDIFAVGDAAESIEDLGTPIRMSVFCAMVMGGHTAKNLAAMLRGKALKPLSFAYYGQGIALGPNDGVGFLTFPADKVIGPVYRGWLGVSIRAFFVWFLLFTLRMEKRIPGFFFWLGKGRYAAVQRKREREQARVSV